jgi:hypothetical protein
LTSSSRLAGRDADLEVLSGAGEELAGELAADVSRGSGDENRGHGFLRKVVVSG